MGMLFKTVLRLATLGRLKARRTELLLDKSYLPQWEMQTLSTFGYGSREHARLAELKTRIQEQLDAVNNEIGRRGGK